MNIRTPLLLALFAASISSLPAQTTANTVVGQKATLTVNVLGTAPFTYQWVKDGTNISGGTAAAFVIASLRLADAGTYTVVVSNPAGSSTSTDGILNVSSLSAFTLQPLSQSAQIGSSVTFSALAAATPAPTYQWLKNSVLLVGATKASLTIPSVAASDAGSYTVVATNLAGNVTSSAAVLTVSSVPPTVTGGIIFTVN